MLSMAQTPSATATTTNPLLIPSTLSYGAPDFNRIKASDYLPALEAAIAQQRKAINAIAESKQTPTFRNTILAYENSGKLLDRVSSIFFCVDEADKTPEIAATEKAIMPQLTQLDNDISFNEKLFRRVKYVYDHEFSKLKGEDRRLLEEIYKGFVRNGALLSKEKKARVEQINKRISDLQQQWGTQLQEATNNAVVWVNSKEELAGLSDADIAQCEKDAQSRGAKAPYAIVIINTTQQPILTNLDNRDLRRRVYEASVHRSDGTGRYNTLPIVVEMAKLRAEKARSWAITTMLLTHLRRRWPKLRKTSIPS